MITTKHNAQKIKRKESKHTTLENHQITKGESKRKEQRNYTTARKEDDNNKFLPINNDFKYEGVNSPIKRHRVLNELKFF